MVIGPWLRVWPEECSLGGESEIGADGGAGETGPVSDLDCQPEAGGELDAAETHQRVDHREVLSVRGQIRDVLFQRFQVLQLQDLKFNIGFEGQLRGALIEMLVVQPGDMCLGPVGLFRVVQSFAQ